MQATETTTTLKKTYTPHPTTLCLQDTRHLQPAGTRRREQTMNASPIYIVSGGEGTSGEQVVRTALAQFTPIEVPVVIVPQVREAHQLQKVIREAKNTRGTIVHTLVDAQLRKTLILTAREQNVEAIDLIGGLLSRLTSVLNQEPRGQPGLYRQLRENYFERIEAIEFTVRHDDGRHTDELHQAEIVLTGVSRVGKTPLSMYLSIQGWKVANVPLVLDIPPPDELFAIDPRRVVGLTINPGQLVAHRRWRQKRMKLSGKMSYTDPSSIYDQLEYAQRIFKRGGFVTFDVTDKPIEESATDVIALISRRNSRSPSA